MIEHCLAKSVIQGDMTNRTPWENCNRILNPWNFPCTCCVLPGMWNHAEPLKRLWVDPFDQFRRFGSGDLVLIGLGTREPANQSSRFTRSNGDRFSVGRCRTSRAFWSNMPLLLKPTFKAIGRTEKRWTGYWATLLRFTLVLRASQSSQSIRFNNFSLHLPTQVT